MPFSESLTVHVLADTAQFDGALARLLEQMRGLGEEVAAIGEQSGLASFGSRIGEAVQPLQRVSGTLARIAQQVDSLDGMSIHIDTQPAIRSLQRLLDVASATAAQLQLLGAISSVSSAASIGSIPAAGGPTGPRVGSAPGFATGGLVTGPRGVDRVLGRLSAGEYVLRAEAVRSLGKSTLDRMNAGLLPAAAARPDRTSPETLLPASTASPPVTTVNHFGGITVQAAESLDLAQILDELALSAARLRTRRG